jgi:hypothetical protein
MTIARMPLASKIESRTNSLDKDSLSKNCYFETKDGMRRLIKRPGCTDLTGSAGTPGKAMWASIEDLWAATGGHLYRVNTGSNTLTDFGVVADAPISFAQTKIADGYIFLQDQTNGYYIGTGDTSITQLAGNFPTGPLAYGAVYLDGFIFVATVAGRIYNSGIENPTIWNGDFITAEAEPDSIIGIVKHFNYLVSFGTWSTEFFYDAATPTGSPLLRNDAARLEIGCANGGSIVQIEQAVLWVGKSRQHGKSVFIMDGLSPVKVSTPYIEKFLNADQLDDVRACTFKIAGHTFYVLTLFAGYPNGYTFIYDIDEKEWYNWTKVNVNNVESYFSPMFITEFQTNYYAMDGDTGNIYTISTTVYDDVDKGIQYGSTTPISDSGTTKRKFYRRVEVVGDKVSGTFQICHSDDDYQTWSAWREISLSATRAQLYNMGQARRRAWKFLCTDAVPIKLDAIEMDFDIGDLETQTN